MEYYSLYSHSVDVDGIVSIVRNAFHKAVVDVNQQNEHAVITVVIKGGIFSRKQTLKLQYRQRLFPSYHLRDVLCEVSNQFLGMYHYVAALPAADADLQGRLLKKIETFNSEITLTAEPVLSPAMQHLVYELAVFLNAILFVSPGVTLAKSPVQHFLDSSLHLLLDAEGNTGSGTIDLTISSRYFDDPAPATGEQLQRKERSEALLTQRGIRVNHHLPVVPGVADTVLRDAEEIIERIYCLTVLAAKGEGVEKQILDNKIAALGITGFTTLETALYEKDVLTEQERANITWRYEGINVLLWALGFSDNLVYPSVICDVPDIVDTVINESRPMFESRAVLRDTATILDELDMIYRMHWASVEARLHHQHPEGGLDASIVYERHYALNWLTNYQEQAWDEVTTDT